jgi:hypothetical protein
MQVQWLAVAAIHQVMAKGHQWVNLKPYSATCLTASTISRLAELPDNNNTKGAQRLRTIEGEAGSQTCSQLSLPDALPPRGKLGIGFGYLLLGACGND